MAKTPRTVRAAQVMRRPLVQPNIHPESARAQGQKPAGRIAQRIGRGLYVLPLGGSRPKP